MCSKSHEQGLDAMFKSDFINVTERKVLSYDRGENSDHLFKQWYHKHIVYTNQILGT